MNKIFAKGFSTEVAKEKLKVEEGKVWYLPQHRVYHPQKKEKIHVAFIVLVNIKEHRLTRSNYRAQT